MVYDNYLTKHLEHPNFLCVISKKDKTDWQYLWFVNFIFYRIKNNKTTI